MSRKVEQWPRRLLHYHHHYQDVNGAETQLRQRRRRHLIYAGVSPSHPYWIISVPHHRPLLRAIYARLGLPMTNKLVSEIG